jgi:hypothetical protein
MSAINGYEESKNLQLLVTQTFNDFHNGLYVTYVYFTDKQLIDGYHMKFQCMFLQTAQLIGLEVSIGGVLQAYGYRFLKVGCRC